MPAALQADSGHVAENRTEPLLLETLGAVPTGVQESIRWFLFCVVLLEPSGARVGRRFMLKEATEA